MIEIVYRYDPEQPRQPRQPSSAGEAKRLLESGNRTFADLLSGAGSGEPVRQVIPFTPRDVGWGDQPGVGPAQAPFAVVLGCSDARVPTEMVFQQGSNSLFVVRVAGNIVGSETLASLLYAVQHFAGSLKLVVVLGHSHCGAVTAAVDVYLRPDQHVPLVVEPGLKSIVDAILAAVRSAALTLEETHGPQVVTRAGYREALLAISVVLNAAWAAFSIRQLVGPGGQSDIEILFSIYDLDTRTLRLPLSTSDPFTTEEIGLFAAPKDPEELRNLARTVCTGGHIEKLLGKHL